MSVKERIIKKLGGYTLTEVLQREREITPVYISPLRVETVKSKLMLRVGTPAFNMPEEIVRQELAHKMIPLAFEFAEVEREEKWPDIVEYTATLKVVKKDGGETCRGL